MTKLTLGFKSGRSVTIHTRDVAKFVSDYIIGSLEKSGWYADEGGFVVQLSELEYVMPTNSILESK